jgi:hypothetical protein
VALSLWLRAGALAVAVAVAAVAEGARSPEVVAAGTVLVWWSVIVVLAVGRLSGSTPAPVPAAAIATGACLAGVAALSFLSMVWAGDDGRAFAVGVRVALYAGVFVLVVALSAPRDARSWLTGLALGLATVCAIALGGRLIPGIDPEAGMIEALPAARGRLSFPLGYWNGLGALAAFAVVVLTWAGARGATRLERAGATAAIPLACLALYLTNSRGAIVAAGIGMVALVVFGPARTRVVGAGALGLAAGGVLVALASARTDLRFSLPTDAADSQGVEMLVATLVAVGLVGILRFLLDAPLARIRIPRLAGAIAVAIGVVVLIGGVATADPGRWIDEFREPPPEGVPQDPLNPQAQRLIFSAAGHGRWQFWQAAGSAFREEPVTGLGAGGFRAWWSEQGTLPLFIEHSHSIFLDHLAELGPLGLLLIAAVFAIGIGVGWRRRLEMPGGEASVAAALLIAAVVAFAIDWSWSIPGVALPVLAALAIVTGPSTSPASDRPAAGRGRARAGSGAGLATAVILVAWASIWAGGLTVLSEIKLSQSRAAVGREDLDRAIADADDAATIQPWSAAPRLQLGLVRELDGDLLGARDDLAAAAARAPGDWDVWCVLGRVEWTLGNEAAAAAAFVRADELLVIDAQSLGPPEGDGSCVPQPRPG